MSWKNFCQFRFVSLRPYHAWKWERRWKERMDHARRINDRDEIFSLQADRNYEDLRDYQEQEVKYTNKQLRKARRLRATVPARPHSFNTDDDGIWNRCDSLGQWYLTDRGIAMVREAIREELRWVREQRAHLVQWITLLTGLVGAMTGLSAVLLGKQ